MAKLQNKVQGGGMSEEQEKEEEAGAIDDSYSSGGEQPQFEEIKTTTDGPQPGRLSRSSTYEANPYDIDRVNTRDSFSRSRASSRARA